MTESLETHRIGLEDNSEIKIDNSLAKNMAEAQDKTENATQDVKEDAPAQETEKKAKSGSSSSFFSKPESLGNSAGEYLQNTMAPVGKYTGKGLETVARPVGGIIDPLVGGVMKGGKAFGEQTGVGFGNAGGGPAKQEEEEDRRMHEPVGGEEPSADNPLGLHQGGSDS